MTDSGFERRVARAAHDEFEARKRAEKELAKEASDRLETLEKLAGVDDVAVRRTVVEILRRSAADSPPALRLLATCLRREQDIKTRRRISRAIGESGNPEMCGFLLEQLDLEKHRFVQASLILALGKLGFSDWPQRWKTMLEEEGPVGAALRQALPQTPAAGRKAEIAAGRQARPAGRYLLRVYPGTEALLEIEWRRLGGGRLIRRAPGWVEVTADSERGLSMLAKARTILGDFRLLSETRPQRDYQEQLLSGVGQIEGSLDAGAHTFRLSLPRMKTRGAYRSAVLKAGRIISQRRGWINNPSDYDVDLRVEILDGASVVMWRHRNWPEARRGEKRTPVAASIHPTVAAGLCLAALEDVPDERKPMLLDPCCGAGTILHEWLSLTPESSALGFDASMDAVKLSRSNLAVFAGRFSVQKGDMTGLPLGDSSVDAVIANLPFGLRVKHSLPKQALYRGFVREAARALRPGSPLIAYTADRRTLTDELGRADFADSEPWLIVNAGGINVAVFRIKPAPGQQARPTI